MKANFNLAYNDLGPPGSSYKAICNWLLPVLDLAAGGGGLTLNQDHLPLVLGLQQISKAPGGSCLLPRRLSH